MVFDFRKNIGSGGGGDVTLIQTTGTSTSSAMSQKAISDRIEFTNALPVSTAIGGIKVGTVFNKVPVLDIITSLLYPYQNPGFTAFAIDGQTSGSFELGYIFPAGSKLFTWNISTPDNIKPNTITLNTESGLANTNSKSQLVTAITKTAVGNHSFTIKALNTNNVEISRNITFNWLAKRFWGVSSATAADDTLVKSFSSELSNSKSKTVTYDGSGGKYFYFAYPSSFGDLSATTINSLAWNDWLLTKRDFINANGVIIPMNIYRSNNIINGSLTVVWG